MPTTLAIIHPRELIRAGRMSVSKTDGSIRVVGHGATAKDAQKLLKQHPTNVLLLHDQLKGEDSFAVAKKLLESNPRLKIVMIGVQTDTTYMARSVAAGVHDYVTEGSSERQICDSIRNAASGTLPTSQSLKRCLSSSALRFRRVSIACAARYAAPRKLLESSLKSNNPSARRTRVRPYTI